MPTLGFTNEGYYSIFACYPNSGNVTYKRIPEQALVFLQNNGVSVEKAAKRIGSATYGRVPFDQHILDRLIQSGLVSSGGSGITPHETKFYQAEPTRSAFDLKIVESSDGWQLVIEIPKLPKDWLSSISLLHDLSIEVEGRKFAAMRLLPGSSSALVTVEPVERSYIVRLHGEWPPSWDAPRWAANVPPLPAHKPVLFTSAEQGGIRLPFKSSVQVGETYLVMVGPMRDDMDAQRMWPPPVDVRHHSLGRQGEWEVFSILLPSPAPGGVVSWLSKLDYCLHGQKWSFSILSLPLRIDPSGKAAYEQGQPLIVQVFPPSATTQFHPVEVLLESGRLFMSKSSKYYKRLVTL